jgi:membrane-bound ClpP family serine protease
MKEFLKKNWEGALVAQLGLGFILYEYYTKSEITSVGISFIAIGNLIFFGKLFYKNK